MLAAPDAALLQRLRARHRMHDELNAWRPGGDSPSPTYGCKRRRPRNEHGTMYGLAQILRQPRNRFYEN
jgi:hypothetical protein